MFHFYKQPNCKIPIVTRASLNIVDRKITHDYQRSRANLSDIIINDSRTYKPPSPRRKIRPEDINIRPRVLPESAKGRLTKEERVQYSKEIQDTADKYAMIGEKVITKLFQAQVNDPADVEYINRRNKLMSTGLTKEEADNILISTFRPQYKTKKAVDLTRMDVLVSDAISITKQLLNKDIVEVEDIAKGIDVLNDSILNNEVVADDINMLISMLASNPELRVDYKPGDPFELLGMLSNIVVGNLVTQISEGNRLKDTSTELKEILDGVGAKEIAGILNAKRFNIKKFIEENKRDDVEADEEDILSGNIQGYMGVTYPRPTYEQEEEYEEPPLGTEEFDPGEEYSIEEGKYPIEQSPEDTFELDIIDILQNSSNIEGDLKRVLDNPLFGDFNALKFKTLISDAINSMEISDDEKVKYKSFLMSVVNEKFRVPEEEFKPVTELFREEVKKELIEAGSTADYAPIKEKYKERITEENMNTIIKYEKKQIYETPKKKKKAEDVPVPPTPEPTPAQEEKKQTDVEKLIDTISSLKDTSNVTDIRKSITNFNNMVKPSGDEYIIRNHMSKETGVSKDNKAEWIKKLKDALEKWRKDTPVLPRELPAKETTITEQEQEFKLPEEGSTMTEEERRIMMETESVPSTMSLLKRWGKEKSILDGITIEGREMMKDIDKYIEEKNMTITDILTFVNENIPFIYSQYTTSQLKTTRNKAIIINKLKAYKETYDDAIEKEKEKKKGKKGKKVVKRVQKKKIKSKEKKKKVVKKVQKEEEQVEGQGMKRARGRPMKEKKPKQKRAPSDWILFVKSVAKTEGLKYGDALKVASLMKKK